MVKLEQAAKEVFIYSLPLVLTELIHWGSDDKGFLHCRTFPTGQDKRVTKLNMDTLYSYAWTQLANTPYLIHIPEIKDRYYLFPIMDAYTSVIYSIGTRTPELSHGDYIFLYRDTPVPKGYEDYRVLRSEDSLNSILLRIETRGKKDYAYVNALQDKIIIKPLDESKVKEVPSNEEIVPVEYLSKLSAQEYFTLFARLAKKNAIKDERMIGLFEKLGYQSGISHLDFEALYPEQKMALQTGLEQGFAEISSQIGNTGKSILQNGWKTLTGEVGAFGKKYLERAATTWGGWGGNIVADTLYSTTYHDSSLQPLKNSKCYKLHFQKDGFPRAAIFWSITLYGLESRYPVVNKLERYSFNSYDIEDGILERNPDGSLDIFISRTEPEGMLEKKNWVPAPQNEEGFSLSIRNYWPDQVSLEGKWEPPIIKSIE